MNKPAFDPTQPFQSLDAQPARPAFDPSQPFQPADPAADRGVMQNAWEDIKAIPQGIGALAGKTSDMFMHGMDAASGFGAEPFKQDLYDTGNTVFHALPHPTGDSMAGDWSAGDVLNHFKNEGEHPLDSLHNHPIGTLLDAATVYAPFASRISGAASAAGDVAGATQAAEGPGLGTRIANTVAQPFDDMAVNFGQKALGATKRFLGDTYKADQAAAAAKAGLQNKVITAFSSPEDMAAKAAVLEKFSGEGIGKFLKDQTAAAGETPAAPPPPSDLPVITDKLKTGDPQAVYNYNWRLSNDMPSTPYFKLMGDPDKINQMTRIPGNPGGNAWMSDVGLDTVEKSGIPISGKAPTATDMPPEVLQAYIKGLPPPAAQTNPGLFNPGDAIKQLDSMRPMTANGQLLKGGAYDAINAKIDSAIQTIQAHGNQPLGWDEANQLKGTLQDQANYKSNANATMLDKQIAGKFRGTLDNSLENAAAATGNEDGFQDFLGHKKNYQAANNMQDYLQNRISSMRGNKSIGLTDTIAGAGQLAAGNPVGAAVTVASKQLAEKYGATTIASGSFKLANMIRQAPQSLGSYAGVLTNALSRGDQALAATDYVLQQRDPAYRQMLDGLSGAGQ